MRTVKKNVYYCDYCKKKGLSSFHMSKHEKHCTANPDRECRLCGFGNNIKSDVEQLKARFEIVEITPSGDDFYGDIEEVNYFGEEITLDEVKDLSEGCPICTLAILRQAKLHYGVVGFNFDYKSELAQWHRDNSSQHGEGDCY